MHHHIQEEMNPRLARGANCTASADVLVLYADLSWEEKSDIRRFAQQQLVLCCRIHILY